MIILHTGHHWPKNRDCDFYCPKCHQGFIDDLEDVSIKWDQEKVECSCGNTFTVHREVEVSYRVS